MANVPLVELLLEAGAERQCRERGRADRVDAGGADRQRRAGGGAGARAGADVNRRERMRDQSAVMWAAAQNHPDMVKFLVSKGADLSIRADATDWGSQITNEPRVQYRPVGGLTPLLYAARAGCLDCVKTMIARGCGQGPAEPRRDDADDHGARQRLPGGRPVPARAGRQSARVGLVGADAALRGGDDARRA